MAGQRLQLISEFLREIHQKGDTVWAALALCLPVFDKYFNGGVTMISKLKGKSAA